VLKVVLFEEIVNDESILLEYFISKYFL